MLIPRLFAISATHPPVTGTSTGIHINVAVSPITIAITGNIAVELLNGTLTSAAVNALMCKAALGTSTGTQKHADVKAGTMAVVTTSVTAMMAISGILTHANASVNSGTAHGHNIGTPRAVDARVDRRGAINPLEDALGDNIGAARNVNASGSNGSPTRTRLNAYSFPPYYLIHHGHPTNRFSRRDNVKNSPLFTDISSNSS